MLQICQNKSREKSNKIYKETIETTSILFLKLF